MNTLEKINKAKYETAEEISEQIYTIMEREFSNMDGIIPLNVRDFHNYISDYIRKEHLHESDYTK